MKKETKKQKELRLEWEAVLARHSKPLERGAKAFGIKVKAQKKAADVPSTSILPAPFEKFVGSTAKIEKKYTGNQIIGIATMHKSSAVPIFNKEAAIDVAQMRRN